MPQRHRRPYHRKITRAVLAETCGCNIRTITRDIKDIQAAHIPLHWEHAAHSYVLPYKGWLSPLGRLTFAETMGLALVRGLLTGPTVPYANAVRSALEKITTGLPPSVLTLLDSQAALIYTSGRSRDYSHAPIAPLLHAAFSRQQVEIDYESLRSAERSWRPIDPYGIEDSSGRVELHAWCHRRHQVLTFALDRIHGVRPTGQTFEVRETEWRAFTEEQGVIGGIRGKEKIEVQVRFDPIVASYARALRWPSSLSHAMQEDGALLLTGFVLGLEGIVPELCRWRRHAHVLGGPRLRQRMTEEVRAMAELYKESDPEL